jgi:hypothetical protein
MRSQTLLSYHVGKISGAKISKLDDIIVGVKNKIACSALSFFLFSIAVIFVVEQFCTGFNSHFNYCVKVYAILSQLSLYSSSIVPVSDVSLTTICAE